MAEYFGQVQNKKMEADFVNFAFFLIQTDEKEQVNVKNYCFFSLILVWKLLGPLINQDLI